MLWIVHGSRTISRSHMMVKVHLNWCDCLLIHEFLSLRWRDFMDPHVRWDSQNSLSLCLTEVAFVAKACHSPLTFALLMGLLLFPHPLCLPLTIISVILFCPLFKTLSLPVGINGMTSDPSPSLAEQMFATFFSLNYTVLSCGSLWSHLFDSPSLLYA